MWQNWYSFHMASTGTTREAREKNKSFDGAIPSAASQEDWKNAISARLENQNVNKSSFFVEKLLHCKFSAIFSAFGILYYGCPSITSHLFAQNRTECGFHWRQRSSFTHTRIHWHERKLSPKFVQENRLWHVSRFDNCSRVTKQQTFHSIFLCFCQVLLADPYVLHLGQHAKTMPNAAILGDVNKDGHVEVPTMQPAPYRNYNLLAHSLTPLPPLNGTISLTDWLPHSLTSLLTQSHSWLWARRTVVCACFVECKRLIPGWPKAKVDGVLEWFLPLRGPEVHTHT